MIQIDEDVWINPDSIQLVYREQRLAGRGFNYCIEMNNGRKILVDETKFQKFTKMRAKRGTSANASG